MNEQQARQVLAELEDIRQRLNGKYKQGEQFLGQQLTDDMDKVFRAVGWMLVPVKQG